MSAAGPRDAIEEALQAYRRSPGSYVTALRQPVVLFGAMREVLQIAAGRAAHQGAPDPEIQQAALFFVRQALLTHGADHYALLGLPHDADEAAIKDRYRLLMRLLHPDFAATLPGVTWPPDAAARLNRAYEVLMSPVSRRQYDEQRPPPVDARQAPPAHRAPVAIAAGAKTQPPRDPRRLLWRLAAGFGALGGLALLGFLAPGVQERPELVQRSADAADAHAHPSTSTSTTSAAAPTPATAQAPRESAPPAPGASALTQAGVADAAPSASLSPVSPPLASPPAAVAALAAPSGAPLPKALPAPAVAAQPALANAAPPAPSAVAPAAPKLALAPAPATQPSAPAARTPQASPGAAPAPQPVAVAAPQRPAPPLNAPLALAPAPTMRPAPPPAAPAPAAPLAAPPPASPGPVSLTTASLVAAAPSGAVVSAALPRPAAGPSMADVHPQLSRLLQQLESGAGDQLLAQLDRDARAHPAAQALLRHYNGIVEGSRQIKVARAQFRAEPRDGRLVVTGLVLMQVGVPQGGSIPREFTLQAEFASRDGSVVMTQLARVLSEGERRP